jgi:hypothetical protein
MRYKVSNYDCTTWVVIDEQERAAVAACTHLDEDEGLSRYDAMERAYLIAKALNAQYGAIRLGDVSISSEDIRALEAESDKTTGTFALS